ncbi:NAD-dependent epimerase [Moraxellaceae bacterium AER2_44_116]|nr:NAD-dependent epimerase [Moraxellaceae bacterium]TQC97698.1 NAD-dependent epimerase [Moraxellaceae bacterium AER2_44_116]
MAKILVTGVAGFIGFYVSRLLLARGDEVVGLDNINDYYDVNLKYARLAQLEGMPNYRFIKLDLADAVGMADLFATEKFDNVINLAAQAGVRYSLVNPQAYISSNVIGFTNILEGCRHNQVKHLVYASSSSVYGLNSTMPFSTKHNVDHPVSLYAASKKANELMAHTYSHLFSLPTTGLRFFTVYGPWGRPDMAPFLFTKAILESKPINVFNYGKMERDFTYIDDIAEGVVKVMDRIAASDSIWDSTNPDPSGSSAPYKIYNIGNNNPVRLMDFIQAIENATGMEAIKNYLPMQPGDVPATYANIDDLMHDTNFKPRKSVQDGMKEFVDWYRAYYHV